MTTPRSKPRSRRSAPARRSSTEPARRARDQIFRREGEYWTVLYEGTIFRIKDGKGLRYLAQLLSHPDERIHCGDLWSAAGGHASEPAASAERTRVAVTKRIKASVAKIAILHAGLAKHLTARIKTGYFCVYICEPYGPTWWTL